MWDAFEQPAPGEAVTLPTGQPKPIATPGVSVLSDEADRQIKDIQNRRASGDLSADITQVINADQKYRYRGWNKRPERIARAKALGFEVVPDDDPARWPVDQGRAGKEMGDQILMREPIELYHRKNKRNMDKADRQTRQRIDEAKESINRIARSAGAVGPHQDAAYEDKQTE